MMDFRRTVITTTFAILFLFPFVFVDAKKFDVPAYFVLGDSLVDVGTNNYVPNAILRSNFPPYGETFFHKPTGRFSNGRNIGDFIAEALGLPLAPPFLSHNASSVTGVNFASGGSGFLNTTNPGQVIPMSVQLAQYESAIALLSNKLGAVSVKELISKSIYLVVSGSNDITNYFVDTELEKIYNTTQYITLIIGAYEATLLQLYGSGARKVIVGGQEPIGCAPRVKFLAGSPGCIAGLNEFALGFNTALKALVIGLHAAIPELNILYIDRYNITENMMNDETASGLTNVTSACCGSGLFNAAIQCGKPGYSLCRHPSKYMYWDYIHPTEVVTRRIFKGAWTGNSSTFPINIKQLAAL